MGRRVLIVVFAAFACVVCIRTVDEIRTAVDKSTLHAWLDVGYYVLKAGVVAAFAYFVAKRGPARRRATRPVAFVACATAILSVLVLERPAQSTADALVIAGLTLSVVFAAWIFVATAALGRCFSILPEARGLVTAGPYRLVRHPLYLGELGACAGLVVASPSLRNLACAVAFMAAQAARMRMEERELTEQFPEYADYARRTRRLLPVPVRQGQVA